MLTHNRKHFRNLHNEGRTYKIPSKPLDFGFHIIILVGRITCTPQLRYSSDKARVNFTIAVDGIGDKTDFLPITAFGKLAENVAEYTDKGHLISFEGRVSSGKYTNDAGETVYTLSPLTGGVLMNSGLNVRPVLPFVLMLAKQLTP